MIHGENKTRDKIIGFQLFINPLPYLENFYGDRSEAMFSLIVISLHAYINRPPTRIIVQASQITRPNNLSRV